MSGNLGFWNRWCWILLGGLIVWPRSGVGDVIVYNNLINDRVQFFNPLVEFGDEVIIDPPFGTLESCDVTQVFFRYIKRNFTGKEKARFRIYQNDGPEIIPGAKRPGTILHDSGLFQLLGIGTGTNENLRFHISLPLKAKRVPRNFTWSIEFFKDPETPVQSIIGLSIFNPPEIGNNFNDYWERTKDGQSWLLKGAPGIPINFAAIFWATNIHLSDFRLAQSTLESMEGEGGARVRASVDRQFALESSLNLFQWQTVTNLTELSPPIEFDLAEAPVIPQGQMLRAWLGNEVKIRNELVRREDGQWVVGLRQERNFVLERSNGLDLGPNGVVLTNTTARSVGVEWDLGESLGREGYYRSGGRTRSDLAHGTTTGGLGEIRFVSGWEYWVEHSENLKEWKEIRRGIVPLTQYTTGGLPGVSVPRYYRVRELEKE